MYLNQIHIHIVIHFSECPLNCVESNRIWDSLKSSYNANVPDVVVHVIKYRCHCPKQGLT
ncbi:Zinc finger protein [Gossypium arboreum]|uniref:Zinc finger protein n=1 Tax=Gossypium arboreum TaxID=29729 RepID=A0A0B0NSR8_GOSAR|nr:Zinc finger protein [Gossypium arboreum]